MKPEELKAFYEEKLDADPDKSAAVAGMETLVEHAKVDKSETIHGLLESLNEAIGVLQDVSNSKISLQSGCDLFISYITRLASSQIEAKDFQVIKQIMIDRGETYLENVGSAREKIARSCLSFIRNEMTVLVHSYSRVVLIALIEAKKAGRVFKVLVTESRPDNSGVIMARKLQEAGIESTIILDAEVLYYMDNLIDIVLVGAEGVVMNGGALNKIGTSNIAVLAKLYQKPFYVLCEGYKFTKFFPVRQSDVPNVTTRFPKSGTQQREGPNLVDYTIPNNITNICSDLGILHPAEVADQLLQIYF